MNNKLHYYLPHDIQTDKGKLIGIKRGYSIIEDNKFFNGIEYLDIDLKYYLYPLSCLTETIIHNGVEEIPLVELAKIEGFKGDNYKINDEGCFCEYGYKFTYKDGSFEIWHTNVKQYTITQNQLLLFDYLYSRRINIWGIDAIDPNELGDNNPYKI